MPSQEQLHILKIGDGQVAQAYDIACEAYKGMTRKVSGEPYINHPVAVANILYRNGYSDPHILSASILHDAIEDQERQKDRDYFREAILDCCGRKSLEIVEGVTNPFYPDKTNRPTRAVRQQEIRDKITNAPFQSGLVKVGDIEHNTSNVHKLGDKFARLYLGEKLNLFRDMESRWGDVAFFRNVQICLEQRLDAVEARFEAAKEPNKDQVDSVGQSPSLG